MPHAEVNPTGPLTDGNKKDLEDIKAFGELVQKFSEKLGGNPGEQRVNPMILFVKNYFRYYSTVLLDHVSDVEFRNSRYYFEITVNSLADQFGKLSLAYTAIFDDEQIATQANNAVQEIRNERGF